MRWVNLTHQFCHLVAGPGAIAAGIGGISITRALAFARAVIAHLGAGLAYISKQWRVMLHEVGGRHAHFSAILQHSAMLRLGVRAALLLACIHRVHARCITVQAVLNALLHLHLAHRIACILHFSLLPFYIGGEYGWFLQERHV